MERMLRDRFLAEWRRHFGAAGLPIVCAYTDREDTAPAEPPSAGHRCVIGALAQVRRGEARRFDRESVGCFGGKRYFGFTRELSPTFDAFLSCGIPGKVEGERYKRSPELVRRFVEQAPSFAAPARYLVFKRWDRLEEQDGAEVVIFFATPDVLSGLFTLANFDEAEPDGVFSPFAAGCGSIVQYPYLEGGKARPRAVLGMFDVSARPFVATDVLSFAVPMAKFRRMVDQMSESFLITPSWEKVRRRLE
ncbi:MAG: DUF169 domain-containing protein [Candidatus Methylomirabilota bacterium]